MLRQETIITAINKLLGQSARIRKGSDAVYYCPICKHHKKKFEVNLITGNYNCWVCGFRGLSLVSLFRKLNATAECFKILGESLQIRAPRPEEFSISFDDDVDDVPVIRRLPDEFISMSIASNSKCYLNAEQYLLGRNITSVDVDRYNIGYCETGVYKNRIIIPSYDSNGDLNFFSGRDIYNSPLKYCLCEFSKNIIPFELYINFNEPITLVEGQFDAIAVRRNCIPLMGKTLSKKLKTKLLTFDVPRVNVLLDSDAMTEALTICDFLITNDIPAHLVTLNKKDPSELGFYDTWNRINTSKRIEFDDLIKFRLEL